MPRSAQIIPKYSFPHNETYINDYTQVTEVPSSSAGETYMMFVFASPKGQDRKMITVKDGLKGFTGKFGMGPFKLYGQPLLNAYTSAMSEAATLQCMRVTAENAYYANISLFATYKTITVTLNAGTPQETITTKLSVKYTALSTPNLADLGLIDEVGAALLEGIVDAAEEKTVHIQTIVCTGRGSWGNPLRVQYSSLAALDKEAGYDEYKNYMLNLYENGVTLKQLDAKPIIMNDEALVNEALHSCDDVINDPDSGSEYITTYTNYEGLAEIYNEYLTIVPTTHLTEQTFDGILGIDKTTKGAIANFEIDTLSTNALALNALTGVALQNGNDGDFGASVDPIVRRTAMNAAYLAAYSGEYDRAIQSKNKFPTTIILDAGFDIETKKVIASLATKRTDCVSILDEGTSLLSLQAAVDYNSAFGEFVSERIHMVDAYYMKVKCPFSKKIVTVSSTYWLASAYPIIFQRNEGKHIPLAGSNFGVLSGAIKNSVSPVYDPEIDYDLMEDLCDARINFAQVNSKNEVIRATQTTRQDITSDLSEANAMFILLDVKRDCEGLCDTFSYNFAEAEDLNRFTVAANSLLATYANAQVRSITAVFGKSTFEAERNVIHLYVTLANKDLVKTTLIELDVVK